MKKPNQPPEPSQPMSDIEYSELDNLLTSFRTLLTASLARLETKIAAIQPRTTKRKHS